MKRSHLMCSPSHFRREVRGWSVFCMRCLNLVAKDLMLICFFFYICFFLRVFLVVYKCVLPDRLYTRLPRLSITERFHATKSPCSIWCLASVTRRR